jgi:hypothetical protein
MFFFSILLLFSLGFLCKYYIFTIHNFKFSSIASKYDINIISNWINPSVQFKYTLLYKASRDGDTSDKFHELCDKKGSTVIFILTTKKNKFGGYTEAHWNSFDNPQTTMYKSSQASFIFDLNNKKKYPIKNSTKAIICKKIVGPTFGLGPDFSVFNNSFTTPSTCNSPISFTNMKINNEFNGGENEFLIKELEVFLVEVIE